MFRQPDKGKFMVMAFAVAFAAGLLGSAWAQKTSVPKVQDKLALGEEPVRQLVLLMETDKQGKVSKQQFMKFMEAEFARLDKDQTGALDVKEIAHTAVATNHFLGK